MTGETFRQIKLIFVMPNGAFKPQASPCLKSSISGPPSGETFQTTHPVKKSAQKSKKDSLKFAFTITEITRSIDRFDIERFEGTQQLFQRRPTSWDRLTAHLAI